jgi:hypothetical protein
VLDHGGAQRAVMLVGPAAGDRGGHGASEEIRVGRHVQVRRVRVEILTARVGRALVDVDQAVGLRERRMPEQDGVDETEDRGIGADSESEDQHRGCGEAPVAHEPPQAVPRVARERLE